MHKPIPAVLALALVAGCGGHGDSTVGNVAVAQSVAAQSGGDHAGTADLVLPVDAYGDSMEEAVQLGAARIILVGDCLRRFGFTVDSSAAVAQARSGAQAQVQVMGAYSNKRRYGITDLATAKKYGYHTPDQLGRSMNTTPTKTKAQIDVYGSGPMTPAKDVILHGRNADGSAAISANGHQIPEGGCVAEANTKLRRVAGAGQSDLVRQIRAESYHHSLSDPPVLAVFKAWSACMRQKGYAVSEPGNAGAQFADAPTVTTAEIDEATTDVTCKQSTDLVAIWQASEVAYQKKQIDKHSAELDQLKRETDEQRRRVAKVLAGAG